MSTHPLLAGLDSQQQEAVVAPPGPVRIIAGAGTGKTRTLTHRIAYQHAIGDADAATVISVTHSKKAAGELKDRLVALGVGSVRASTFHAAALRQLAHFWTLTGRDGGGPVLIDALPGGQWGVLREAVAARIGKGKSDADTVRDVLSEIEWARASTIRPENYSAEALKAGRDPSAVSVAVAGDVYGAYTAAKVAHNVLDFADLLDVCASLIETNSQVASSIRDAYRHVLVDEYQDTDPAQQRLLDAWLGTNTSLAVVGDPRQTIYSFKGANPHFLTDFPATYPDALTVTLVRDYRSTPQVVDTANALMANAAKMMRTPLTGVAPVGPLPIIDGYATFEDEIAGVVGRVKELVASGVAPREIAVLTRTTAQQGALSSAMGKAHIPTTAEAFYDTPTVKQVRKKLASGALMPQILAGMKFDPDAPPTGVGAGRERWELLNALSEMLVELSLDGVAAGAELQRRSAAGHSSSRTNTVTVSTIHKAKGLEWDAVFVPFLTNGSLPITFAKTWTEKEEERRLLYVALTRGRRHIHLSYSRARTTAKGFEMKTTPSEFLNDLAGVLGWEPPAQGGFSRSSGSGKSSWKKGSGKGTGTRSRRSPKESVGARSATRREKRTVARSATSFAVGQKVVHDRFGLGTVTRVGAKVTIDFGSGGVKPVDATDATLSAL
jgi:DNA helicase-2/ATP-dependent DNA helicase PcrA